MKRLAISVLCGVLASGAGAQAPIMPPPPSAAARDPLSLPGDNLPPPLAAMLAPARPFDPSRPRPVEPPVPPAPPLSAALQGAQAALAQCHAQGFEVGVAVANSAGGLLLGMQADEAHPGRVYNAMRKNLAALAFGVPSSAVRDRLRAGDFATLAQVQPGMTLFPGAIPLFIKGKLAGALAVSGSPSGEVDEGCAKAGVEAVAKSL